MTLPLRFVDDDYTPRLWDELYPVLCNMKTEDLINKKLSYMHRPVDEWRADDWGLLDALNRMLTLRASSRQHSLRNDSPAIRETSNAMPSLTRCQNPGRADARALVKLMQSVSRQKPKMWGQQGVATSQYHLFWRTKKKNGIGVIAFTSKVVDGDVLTIEGE